MSTMASQITSITIVYSTIYSSTDEEKNQSVTDLCAGIRRWPVNSRQKGPVTWKKFPFDDVIMCRYYWLRPTENYGICAYILYKYDMQWSATIKRDWWFAVPAKLEQYAAHSCPLKMTAQCHCMNFAAIWLDINLNDISESKHVLWFNVAFGHWKH